MFFYHQELIGPFLVILTLFIGMLAFIAQKLWQEMGIEKNENKNIKKLQRIFLMMSLCFVLLSTVSLLGLPARIKNIFDAGAFFIPFTLFLLLIYKHNAAFMERKIMYKLPLLGLIIGFTLHERHWTAWIQWGLLLFLMLGLAKKQWMQDALSRSSILLCILLGFFYNGSLTLAVNKGTELTMAQMTLLNMVALVQQGLIWQLMLQTCKNNKMEKNDEQFC